MVPREHSHQAFEGPAFVSLRLRFQLAEEPRFAQPPMKRHSPGVSGAPDESALQRHRSEIFLVPQFIEAKSKLLLASDAY